MTNRTTIVLLVWLPTLQLVAAWQPAPLSRNLNKRHPRVRVATTAVPRAATTTDNEYTSSSSYNNDDGGDGWSVADDWESLSAENPTNSVPDSATLFNQDIASQAAQSILADNHGDDAILVTEEDVWLNEVIEDILQNPLSSTPLYDTRLHDDDEPGGKSRRKTTTTTTKEDDCRAFEEHMGAEIAMLVRCNESPEDMLVTTGRALEELTVAQKQDVSQLLVWKNVDTTHSDTDNDIETTKATAGRWEPTLFFRQALATMFHVHASSTDNDDKEEATMDAKAISRWMTQSLGSELDSYTQRKSKGQGWKNQVVTRETKTIRIGPHDSRVLAAISKYSTYGTGKVALDNFVQLYMDALVQTKSGETLDEQESLEVLKVYNADHIRQVWRDLGNHGIVGPTEQAWKREQAKLEAEHGSLPDQLSNHHDRKQQSSGNHVDFFVDECEILDFTYDAPPTEEQIESGHDAKNNKYIKKGSHEQVPLANDGKTPLYMDEGDFVFIDEESCIGCMQCVNAAPASFLMLDNGRARTFHQRQGPDVKQGVAACPVSCMHFVSFDELQELETVRDKGDGRDDHRHMGHRRGHTPLFVAGIDSDNNHRSSWYHHLKNKCDSTGQCPQRGCFDCPSYSVPGGNPYFQKKAKAGQHTRAQYFVDHGDVDLWRKTAEL